MVFPLFLTSILSESLFANTAEENNNIMIVIVKFFNRLSLIDNWYNE